MRASSCANLRMFQIRWYQRAEQHSHGNAGPTSQPMADVLPVWGNRLVAEPPHPTTLYQTVEDKTVDLGPFGNLDEFMPPPGLDAEAVDEEKDESQNREREAPTYNSKRHNLITHFPMDPNSEICKLSKMQNGTSPTDIKTCRQIRSRTD